MKRSRSDLLSLACRAASDIMGHGVVVLDEEDQFVAANAAARILLELPTDGPGSIGLTAYPGLREILNDPKRAPGEFSLGAGQQLEVRISPLDPSGCGKGTRVMIVRDVSTRSDSERRLLRLVHYDALTGLANRRLFLEKLPQAIDAAKRNGHRLALLYMDLDRFKEINDSLGHGAGDQLLRALAHSLRQQLRSSDLIGHGEATDPKPSVWRLGGDEFAVSLSKIASPENAGDVAARVLRQVASASSIGPGRTVTTVSIGIAMFPEDGESIETLVEHADTAMYRAKERGGNCIQFYDPSLNERARRKLSLEGHLRQAIEKQELELLYQPKVDLATGSVEGGEALLRWQSAELGAVSPKEFVPIAEKTDLIVSIGAWVIETVCKQVRAWRDAGYAPLPVAVNVSSHQVATADFFKMVPRSLREHEVDPQLLELELTESALLQDAEAMAIRLRDLQAIGVKIALDDFGKGYSSLSYLSRVPLDTLKMDRCLVRDIDCDPAARGVAAAVIAMAHSLGLKVVAEGVDCEDQVSLLQEMGCDQLQGFLFSAALPADEFRRFLPVAGGSARTVRVAQPSSDDLPALRDEPARATDRHRGR